MSVPGADAIVDLWERGAGRSAVERGLILMELALPEAAPEERLHLSIGHRDSCLIDLRERLFGGRVEAVSDCRGCGEPVAMDFDVEGIRVRHAPPGTVIELAIGARP